MPTTLTLNHLRRYAIARSLFKPRTLGRAVSKLGFVQFDPIRAPARAQDLTLRHRVTDYRAGDLEARYPRLAVEEDFFVNYGVLPRATQCLMHPRTARNEWSSTRWGQVIGWANAAVRDGQLRLQPGYVSGRAPRESALQEEQARLEWFLGL